VWFCGIWEPHRYRVVSAPCRVHVMVIRPQMLAGLSFPEAPSYKWLLPFTVAPRQRPQPDRAMKKSVLQWAKRMEHASATDPRRRGLVQRVMLLELLLMLSEDWRPAETSERPSGHYARVNRAVQLVFENPVGLTASRAAKLSGLSRNHFNRVFDETMGLSFAKFSLRYRLSGAARQVVGSDDPLKSIAARWGFTDASHLLRCFRQHYGCTPKAYRQERTAGASAL
jgi:AraC-like DNA-binding protein